MNWSGKMWALETPSGRFVRDVENPVLFVTRREARFDRAIFYPTTKVVRVQVDVKVIE